jgi:hypothetical protein
MNKPRTSLSPSASNVDIAAPMGEAVRVRMAFKVAEAAARCGDLAARFVVARCLDEEPKAFAAVKAQFQAQVRGGRVLWERFLDTMEAV